MYEHNIADVHIAIAFFKDNNYKTQNGTHEKLVVTLNPINNRGLYQG